MFKRFQKKKEDFTCEKCGNFVVGTGYTNHCPKCLWAKHVDIFPGDRFNDCQGMMEPISILSEKKGFILVHKCKKCGEETRNRVSRDDDLSCLLP